ncbi:hypothetical protein LMG24235_08493 [Paraburkholderia sabiae]|nr:hypothetical protein LMG24235_08493 [Paraburkholderia sabiae]
MGTAGDAYDNAMCESFFGTLEAELLSREHLATHEQAWQRIFWFLELGSSVLFRPRSPRRTVRASLWAGYAVSQRKRKCIEQVFGLEQDGWQHSAGDVSGPATS